MTPVEVITGDSPVILGQPHGGLWLPDGLLPGASVERVNFHGYMIDANRDPEGESLYLTSEAAPWIYDTVRNERLRAALAEIMFGLDRIARSGTLSN